MKYLDGSVSVQAVQWRAAGALPPLVHDEFILPGETSSAYLRTPDGDVIVSLGDWIVYYDDGWVEAYRDAEFRAKFVKDE